MANFYCVNCGQKFASVQSLSGGFCSHSPAGFGKGRHELYEGSEKSMYTCKFCGQQFNSLQRMVVNTCPKHPNGFGKGNHRPTL